MEKPRFRLSVVFIVLAVFVVVVLTYVSILGENHNINRVIVYYFNNLKDGEYLEACKSFSANVQDERLSSTLRPLEAAMAQLDKDFEVGELDEQVYRQERKSLEARIQEMLDEHCLNFNFFLELSLLQHYNLIDHYDYKVELKRNHFWIPFVGDDSVGVSVLLRKKEDKGVTDGLTRSNSSEPIRDLIIMGREKGSWHIRQFGIDDSSISGMYNNLRQSIDINTYTEKTTNGFCLKDADINFKTLTPIDKRLLRFSLYRIKKSLDPPDTKDKGVSPTYPSL